MFECPAIDDVNEYIFCISYDSVEIINGNNWLIKQKEVHPVAHIKQLPLGKKYKWKVIMNKTDGSFTETSWHYFEILNSKLNKKKYFRINQHYYDKSKVEDGIIWCDQYRCAVDRKGNIVWFMADPQNDLTKTKAIRDIRLQPDGSLTLLNYPNAIKTDLTVSDAWELPYKKVFDEKEFWGFHHSLEILPNGNFMTMANEKVNFSNENTSDTLHSSSVDFCNIVEFDKNGNLVWLWKMKEHFPFELLVNSRIKTTSGVVDPHSNSFCHDSSGKYLYINYRDISRVIKIDKSTKEIVTSYGLKLKDEDDVFETHLFRLQHDIQYLGNNNFLLFNNDEIDSGKVSSIEEIHFPVDSKDRYKLLWKYNLNYEKNFDGRVERMGSVKRLKNGNYLICAGSSNRIFEVTRNKKVVWDFYIQQLDSGYKVNKFFSVYRAYFTKSLYPNYFVLYKKGKDLILVNKGDSDSNFEIEYFLNESDRNKRETITVKKESVFKIEDYSRFSSVNVKCHPVGIIKTYKTVSK